jgi:hypothetical protein
MASSAESRSRIWCFPRCKPRGFTSTLIAVLIVTVTATAFVVYSSHLAHWFVLPVSVCGILIGTDAIDWIRGRLELYDLAGIIGVVGLHFFFLAPLLHVSWDAWTMRVPPPPDWRDWLGYMGILNLVGLVLYRLCRRIYESKNRPPKFFWKIEKSRFNLLLPIAIGISTLVQIWTYVQFGGITSYMQSRINDPTVFKGWGWIFMMSESAPILAAFWVVVRYQQRAVRYSRMGFGLFLLFGLQMLFGGLRGSRSETIELLFWAVGCIHLLLRPVPRKFVYLGCLFLAVFMYFYGFYKSMGENAVQAFSSSDERAHLARMTGRTSEFLILGDFARADLQAFILYRLVSDGRDLDYAKGRTYLGALSLLVPNWILSEKPETKVKEGTEIETGSGGYFPVKTMSSKVSSRVYGLAGEGMLNFGPVSVPFAYALFGLLVGWFRKSAAILSPGDARLLFVPFGVYLCISALGGDSDNIVFGIVKSGFVPFLVILCSIKRACLRPIPPELKAPHPLATPNVVLEA